MKLLSIAINKSITKQNNEKSKEISSKTKEQKTKAKEMKVQLVEKDAILEKFKEELVKLEKVSAQNIQIIK